MIDRRNFFALISTAAIAYACGGKMQSAPSASADPTAECGSYFDALEAYAACGSPPPRSAVDKAKSAFVSSCVARSSLPGSRYAEGLQACGEALAGWPCNALGLPWACVVLEPGTLPAGAPCSDTFQCASDACTGDPFVDDGGVSVPTCGTCEIVGSLGDPCFTGTYGGCTAGEVCGMGGTCIPKPSGGVGSSCVLYPCDVGLACSSESNTCVPPSPPGGLCEYHWDCAPGLLCISSTCTTPLTTGQACAGEGECAPGLGCGSSGLCAPRSLAAGGEACDSLHICALGLCPTESSAATCPIVVEAGQACAGGDTGTVCDVGLECLSGACATPPGWPTCD